MWNIPNMSVYCTKRDRCEKQYEHLLKEHEEGCKNNDYSKMRMMGDEKDLAIKQYIRDNNLFKHSRVEEIQGGQIERCLDCGKEMR